MPECAGKGGIPDEGPSPFLGGRDAAASAQTARPARQYTIDQFLTTTAISGASFSADESRILFSSNKSGIWNVYTIPVTGGDWTPVTKSTTDSTYW